MIAITALFATVAPGFHRDSPDLSSPKATVRSFVEALNGQDVSVLLTCLKVDRPDTEIIGKLKKIARNELKMSMGVIDLLAETDGNHAKVAVEFSYRLNAKQLSATDILNLERTGGIWKIVPKRKALDALSNADSSLILLPRTINLQGLLISGDAEALSRMTQLRQKEQAIKSLTNLHKICTGILLYVQDNDETFHLQKT